MSPSVPALVGALPIASTSAWVRKPSRRDTAVRPPQALGRLGVVAHVRLDRGDALQQFRLQFGLLLQLVSTSRRPRASNSPR